MRSDFFLRLPPPTALLLLSSLFDLTQSHALPKPTPTTTLPYRVLDVVSWPLRPTPPPVSFGEFQDLRLRAAADTVCGYIGGDPNLPATCQPGSHCVLDAEHGAIGCCPNGADSCTAGVFTGCVDFNSPAQTQANPYIFTCQGSDVCYKNEFAGGYSQFGCGTASSLATTVAATPSGSGFIKSNIAVTLTSTSVGFTASATSLSQPTTIDPSTGTRPFTRSSTTGSSSSGTSSTTTSGSSTSSTSSSSSSKSSSSSSSTTSSTSTLTTTRSSTSSVAATAAPGNAAVQPSGSGSGVDRTGAIIGGTISGIAVLVAVVAVAFYLYKRRRGNVRQGPVGGSEYISPMNGPDFQAVPQGNTTQVTGGMSQMQNVQPYHYPSQAVPTYAAPPGGASGAGMGAAAVGGAAAGAGAYGAYRGVDRGVDRGGVESDQVPLRSEVDDFSRGFNDALGRIGEEDTGTDFADYYMRNTGGTNMTGALGGTNGARGGAELPTGGGSSSSSSGNGGGVPGGVPGGADGGDPSGSPGRPLWQQNRRQSRNLMWM